MRYKYLVKQKPYCCGPACLQMVLRRRKIRPASQEAIGSELGLVVPPEVAHRFKRVRVGRPHAYGYGTAVNRPKYSLNGYFQRHGMSLRALDILPRDSESARTAILDFLQAGADIIACVDVNAFYGNGIRAGHFLLIENLKKIDGGEDLVGLIDPEDGSRYIISLRHLMRAMNVKRRGWEGGLHIVAEPEVLGFRPSA